MLECIQLWVKQSSQYIEYYCTRKEVQKTEEIPCREYGHIVDSNKKPGVYHPDSPLLPNPTELG